MACHIIPQAGLYRRGPRCGQWCLLRQVDEMTPDNPALVDETKAAIEQREVQAGDLDRIVAIFKL